MQQLGTFYQKHHYIVAFAVILVFWALFYAITGTYKSGFHLTDDHEIIELYHNATTASLGFINHAYGYIHSDIFGTGRFRPFYYTFRFIQIAVLKTDQRVWSICLAGLAVITSFFFYVFAKKLTKSTVLAALFVAWLLVGRQMAIWWRLGPAETIGTVLLSVALLLMILAAQHRRYRLWYEISFIIAITLMSLVKESFVMVIPGMIALKYFLQIKDGRKLNTVDYLWLVVPLLVGLAEILFIKFGMKMGGLSYAGVEGFMPLRYFFIFRTILGFNGWSLVALAAVLSILIVGVSSSQELMTRCRRLVVELRWPIFIVLLIILPQSVLYAKSGINADRYILPSTLALGLGVVWLMQKLRDDKQKYWLYLALVIINVYFLFGALQTTLLKAKSYSAEGQETRAMLQSIKLNTGASSNVVIVSDPSVTPEWSSSIKTFISTESDRANLYALPISNNAAQQSTFQQNPSSFCGNKCSVNITDTSKIDAVLVFSDVLTLFQANPPSWFNLSDFSCQISGNYLQFTLCVRK